MAFIDRVKLSCKRIRNEAHFIGPGGHDEAVVAAKVWNNVLFTASDDATARAWDLQSASCIHEFKGHSQVLTSLDIIEHDENGNSWLLTASNDGTVRAWPLQGMTTSSIPEADPVILQPHNDIVRCVVASGARAFTASDDGVLRCWSLPSGRCTWQRNVEPRGFPITHLAVDGHHLAATTGDKRLLLWRIGTADSVDDPSLILSRALRSSPLCMTFKSGVLILGGRSSDLTYMDVSQNGILSDVRVDGSLRLTCVALDPDPEQRSIYVGASNGTVFHRDLNKPSFEPWKALGTDDSGSAKQEITALCRAGGRLFAGDRDGNIFTWNAENKVEKVDRQLGAVRWLVSDGKRLLSGVNDGRVFAWRLGSWPAERLPAFHSSRSTWPNQCEFFLKSVCTVLQLMALTFSLPIRWPRFGTAVAVLQVVEHWTDLLSQLLNPVSALQQIVNWLIKAVSWTTQKPLADTALDNRFVYISVLALFLLVMGNYRRAFMWRLWRNSKEPTATRVIAGFLHSGLWYYCWVMSTAWFMPNMNRLLEPWDADSSVQYSGAIQLLSVLCLAIYVPVVVRLTCISNDIMATDVNSLITAFQDSLARATEPSHQVARRSARYEIVSFLTCTACMLVEAFVASEEEKLQYWLGLCLLLFLFGCVVPPFYRQCWNRAFAGAMLAVCSTHVLALQVLHMSGMDAHDRGLFDGGPTCTSFRLTQPACPNESSAAQLMSWWLVLLLPVAALGMLLFDVVRLVIRRRAERADLAEPERQAWEEEWLANRDEQKLYLALAKCTNLKIQVFAVSYLLGQARGDFRAEELIVQGAIPAMLQVLRDSIAVPADHAPLVRNVIAVLGNLALCKVSAASSQQLVECQALLKQFNVQKARQQLQEHDCQDCRMSDAELLSKAVKEYALPQASVAGELVASGALETIMRICRASKDEIIIRRALTLVHNICNNHYWKARVARAGFLRLASDTVKQRAKHLKLLQDQSAGGSEEARVKRVARRIRKDPTAALLACHVLSELSLSNPLVDLKHAIIATGCVPALIKLGAQEKEPCSVIAVQVLCRLCSCGYSDRRQETFSSRMIEYGVIESILVPILRSPEEFSTGHKEWAFEMVETLLASQPCRQQLLARLDLPTALIAHLRVQLDTAEDTLSDYAPAVPALQCVKLLLADGMHDAVRHELVPKLQAWLAKHDTSVLRHGQLWDKTRKAMNAVMTELRMPLPRFSSFRHSANEVQPEHALPQASIIMPAVSNFTATAPVPRGAAAPVQRGVPTSLPPVAELHAADAPGSPSPESDNQSDVSMSDDGAAPKRSHDIAMLGESETMQAPRRRRRGN